jgi:hypothetical protein
MLCRATGALPGIIAKQWSQPDLQESFPFDSAHSIAMTFCTEHARSPRNTQVMGKSTIIY